MDATEGNSIKWIRRPIACPEVSGNFAGGSGYFARIERADLQDVTRGLENTGDTFIGKSIVSVADE